MSDAILQGNTLTLPDEYATLAEMFVYIVNKYPTHGMTFIEVSGKEEFISYPDLYQKALTCLNMLAQNGVRSGDVIILELNQPKSFYPVFWACVLGGIVPAPVTKPASFEPGSESLTKLFNIWNVLKRPFIVIESQYQKYYEILKNSPEHPDFKFITTSDLECKDPYQVCHSHPDDLAVLQFSSGSTGTPKGVSLTHKNILSNILGMSRRFLLTASDNSFMWVPHTHDMGLFMQYLSSVMVGANHMVFSNHTFVRSPYLFLKKITEHKGTWFTSPNFGFDWMVRNVPDEKLSSLDLSSLRFSLNAAEPISAFVVKDFIKKFEPCGYSAEKMATCYGLAEATVGVTISKIGHLPKIQKIDRYKMINENIAVSVDASNKENFAEFIQEGPPIEGISVRIADEEGRQLQENEIGEIQVKGASVTSGYFNCDDVNKDLFVDGWLHTGDLGFIADGALTITGRKKDVLIIRGDNYYSHDLEEVVYKKGKIPRGNLAFVSVFNHKLAKEELIAFVKYKRSIVSFLPLREHLIKNLQESLGIEVAHVIPIKSIPKTTSGKVQRFGLKKCYENGDFDQILNETQAYLETPISDGMEYSSTKNLQNLEDDLRSIWSDILAFPIEKISIDDAFFSLGGNSVKAFQLLNELERYLKQDLDIEILVVCKSIRDLSQYIRKHVYQSAEFQESKFRFKSDHVVNRNDEIAITGMALRLPGANNLEEFWSNLCLEKDCFSKVSDKRKKLSGEHDWNGYIAELKDVDCFDHKFFDFSEEEATFMDPQQRLVLEVAYEALEDSGFFSTNEEHHNIGVYSGISSNSYSEILTKYLHKKGLESLHQHALIRNIPNMVSALVSRVFNFTGPSLSVDTACSSFLTALHYAITDLKRGSIEGAVVASANILSTATMHSLADRSGILSSGKYPKVFDETADGSVIGEGVLVFYLEPLDRAVKSKRNIYGVIRGSAINNDGTSFGAMAPSPKGQYEVLVNAYKNAGVSPEELGYVETHGTGTTIGDPIEVNVLAKLFSNQKQKFEKKIGIGSVKTNVGHLLPAAGAVGLAKVLLSLKHKKLVPNLNLKALNPALKLDKTPFFIPKKVEDWNATDGSTRKAGLSSFGFGGTNVHVVLEEYIADEEEVNSNDLHLLTLSAKSKNALENMQKQIEALITGSNDVQINDLCFTRNRYRKHYNYRSAAILSQSNRSFVTHFKEMHNTNVRPPAVSILVGELSDVKSDYWKAFFKILRQDLTSISVVRGNGLCEEIPNTFMPDISLKKELSEIKSDILIVVGKDSDEIIRYLLEQGCDKEKIITLNDATAEDLQINRLSLLAELYIKGVDLNWKGICPSGYGKIIPLPAYPFEKRSLWIET